MQSLPKGVTGFGCTPGQPVLVEQFKTACYAAARRVNGAVLRIIPSRIHNFYEARMTTAYQREVVDVLCNAHYPLIAFTRRHPESPTWPEPPSWRDDRHDFIDCSELASSFAADYVVLSAEEACKPVQDEVIAELDESERHWVRHWRASRVGDIVFNNWD